MSGPRVVASILRDLEDRGLSLFTRLRCGQRTLVAKPGSRVTSENRQTISEHLPDLLELVRFREIEEEKRQAAEPLRIIRDALLAEGLEVCPILVQKEEDRSRAYQEGKLPLTLEEARALAFATSRVVAQTTRVMRRFRSDVVFEVAAGLENQGSLG